MHSLSVLSTSLTRPIVSVVLSRRSVWREALKAIVLIASVLSVIFCPHLPRLSTSERLFCSAQYDGWMLQDEHSAAPGPPIGRGNTLIEVIALVDLPKNASPPPRPPRAVRSHHRWSWRDRLARNAWWGPPQWCITGAGVPAFLASN